MSKTVEHITAAESALKKVAHSTGANQMAGDTDRWTNEAIAHALLAIAYKLIIG